MLDVARRETSLDMKRHELAAQIGEGRAVIATLMERHASLGEKIDVATASLRRMEKQLEALDTVAGLFSDEELFVQVQAVLRAPVRPAPAPAPVAAAVAAEPAPHVRLVEAPAPAAAPEAFKPMTFLRCLAEGHDMVISRSQSGRITCRKCRVRLKA